MTGCCVVSFADVSCILFCYSSQHTVHDFFTQTSSEAAANECFKMREKSEDSKSVAVRPGESWQGLDDDEHRKSYDASKFHSIVNRNIKYTVEMVSGMNRMCLVGVLRGGERYRPRYKNLTHFGTIVKKKCYVDLSCVQIISEDFSEHHK